MQKPSWIEIKESAVLIKVQVQPNCTKSMLAGEHAGRLKVRLSSAPEGNKANKELVSLFACLLNLNRNVIRVKHGLTSRVKVLEVYSAEVEKLVSKILDELANLR